ncbi:Bifunctional uridylyltransferase/uridylyl-removing enzyme [Planctomycetales bacterium 10988]|nr:Bifunctional uridylyltransferase/uridylyl-removing enzyme [Planctomycetales bacterium 10988]
MIQGTNLPSRILEAKEDLLAAREKLRKQHQDGSPGIQVCNAWTDTIDKLIDELFRAAVDDLADGEGPDLHQHVALIAHGGYGRREMAPFSDVDLMILHTPAVQEKIGPLAGRILRDVGDTGMIVGHSVRTTRQALALTAQDASICTSLMESRLLTGNSDLFSHFMKRFRFQVQRRFSRIYAQIIEAREKEQKEYGETVYLLEPNIKRSRGGLRDLQLIRWIGFAKHGTPEPDQLRMWGALSKSDQQKLTEARDFLLHLRNELHFHAKRGQDMLLRDEQWRIAEAFGFKEITGIPIDGFVENRLPVEEFMGEYFRHTQSIKTISERFVESLRPGRWKRTLFALIFSHQVEGDFFVSPFDIRATKRGLPKIKRDLTEVMRLADLASLYDKPIDFHTTEAIREAVPKLSDHPDPLVAKRFLSILDHPAHLASLLRELHQIGVLEKIIPQMAHARSLMQFNQFHKYTVDEHTLLAVQRATEFRDDPDLLGKVYRALDQKWLLHLALILHDLGKGFEEDHSIVGAKFAEKIARRLRLTAEDSETLVFLVRYHLQMTHYAFWRDISDPDLIVKFAVQVGSPERLQLLFLLSAADMMAVGPEVWNGWKAQLLYDLYNKTMEHLSAGKNEWAAQEEIEFLRQPIRDCFSEEWDEWYERQLKAFSASQLGSESPDRIHQQLKQLRQLDPEEIVIEHRWLAEQSAWEIFLATRDLVRDGLVHRVTGAFASKGIGVLRAQVGRFKEGITLDRYWVSDPDYQGEPPEHRKEEVTEAIKKAIYNDDPPKVSQRLRIGQRPTRTALPTLPAQVKIDNHTCETHTIIEIFATDRPGLLYTISRALNDLKLLISVAKIGTHLDQAVDVFYVSDTQGNRIEDQEEIKSIKTYIEEAISAFEEEARSKLTSY